MKQWKVRRSALATTILSVLAIGGVDAQPQTADLLIRGGTIYDGSDGNKGVVGDVAVIGDRIVYVGPHAGMSAKKVIDARGMIVAPGFIDGHAHPDIPPGDFLNNPDPALRENPAWVRQGVSTLVVGVDGMGTPDLKNAFAHDSQIGIGTNIVSYVGFGAVRERVIGKDARAPSATELAAEKQLVAKGMCEGAIGFSAGLFYAPQSFAKTDEVVALAMEAAKRGGIYDTHQRDESSYTVGLINSTKEVLQIGREANIPVHFAHIKALGNDVWGKSGDVIKLIEEAQARGQNVTADQYPWTASSTGLDAALVPRWVEDGGYPAMIKRFNDSTLTERIHKEMTENLRRRNGAHSILLLNKGFPWSGKYLDEVARTWKIDPVDAAIRIMRQSEEVLVVSFNMSQADVDNFMKQPWTVTSSDGSPGHPREYATFPIKYADYVKKRHVIDLSFFIRHSTGLAADMFMLDHRGYLRKGYFADVLVFDPNQYGPRATYVNPTLPAVGVTALLINGKLAVDHDKVIPVLSGRTLPHKAPPGTCL
jgi:N-acyl-D-amino-acid deacylase